ncbi:hypothetical protein ACFUTV_03595 [Streptomyces sp. NPDC057298]|uniref:hypothetical protein n=1 Tax=Streptomyces sp. NPDC057298 TaxID=3346091 RepID=UPI003639D19C
MGDAESVRDVLGDAWWQGMLRQSDDLTRAAEARCPGAVARLDALLRAWAIGFAAVRADVLSPDLGEFRRGLGPDEAAGFLAALDARVLHTDSAGFVVPQGFRRKASGGRYALFSRSGAGVALNLEYLIQLAAAAELISFHHIAGTDICFEKGEFDAVVETDGAPVIAMEAKARIHGPDSLLGLLASLLRLNLDEREAVKPNHRRKYTALKDITAPGPVTLLLVAEGARWAFDATTTDGGLHLAPRHAAHSGEQDPALLGLVP